MSFIKSAVLALATAAFASTALAAFPDRPVKLLVAYTPGGATDVIARILANDLSTRWGQPVVVENKPGASGMIGAETVARAEPDGYTLLLGYTPEVSLNKLVFKDMRYDPLTELTPIALAASAPLVLAAGPKLNAASMDELRAVGDSAGAVSYASPGVGGQQHMAGELLAKRLGKQLTHVPYRGTAPAVADLVGGQIDLFFATAPALLAHIRSGRIKPLAVAGAAREKLLPDVPTTTEVGMPTLQLSNWFGVFGPKALPAKLADSIAADVVTALNSPAVVASLEDKGLTPTPMQGAALRAFITSEMDKYAGIIAETGIATQ